MRRMILVPLLIFLALAAIGGAVAFWIYDSYNYYRTDDAQVSGKIVSVSAPIAGTLTSLNVKSGAQVSAGQTIGSITPVSITSTPGTGGTSGSWHCSASSGGSRTECRSWLITRSGDGHQYCECGSICG